MSRLVYLHGFLSSPASSKVGALREALPGALPGCRLEAPDLNVSPAGVEALLTSLFPGQDPADPILGVVGSSFGGFYAARLAARLGVPLVLLNPCVDPWTRLPEWIGVRTVYGTDRRIEVKPSYEGELLELERTVSAYAPDARRTLVVLSRADEVLDWRQAARRYASCRQLILPAEDHRISGFSRIIPSILAFIKAAGAL